MVATIASRNPSPASLQATGDAAVTAAAAPPPALSIVSPAPSSAPGATVILPSGDETSPGSDAAVAQTPMAISSGTDIRAVKAYLAQNAGQPKVAVGRDGEAFLVFGTSTAADGETMVETASTDNATGGTTWTTLAKLEGEVAYLDPGTAARGTQLTPLSTHFTKTQAQASPWPA